MARDIVQVHLAWRCAFTGTFQQGKERRKLLATDIAWVGFSVHADIAKMFIFSYRRMIMAYSPDFRKKVLETLSRGLSVRTTAALFGIHFTTIQNWKKHPEKAKTPQKRPPKKIRTEELLADIEMYPTDYLSERAKRFKCTPAAIRKAMLRNKFSKKRRY